MRNCVRLLDTFLARGPQHRFHSARASARSCKENRTGAWPTPRTPATMYRSLRMKSRIGPFLVSQFRHASFASPRNPVGNLVAANLTPQVVGVNSRRLFPSYRVDLLLSNC